MVNFPSYDKIIFLDIETVPAYASLSNASGEEQKLWLKKAEYLSKYYEGSPEDLYQRGGIYAEFGKIVCISAGFVFKNSDKLNARIKSYFGDDENLLLKDFNVMISDRYAHNKETILCAHNGKEFDFPYIARRTLVNSLPLPALLNLHGKKPWEIPHIDTMELWKFGDYKHYTSLEVLAHLFKIPQPKADMDGSMVADAYWKNKDLQKIANYCQADVITLMRIFLKLTQSGDIADENVEYV